MSRHTSPLPLIFTDLDGTLLERTTNSHHTALPAVRGLTRARVPLIFCSSRTRAQMVTLRRALGVSGPFIVENGSAIYIPQGLFRPQRGESAGSGWRVIRFGTPAGEVRAALGSIRQRTALTFRGFCEMPYREVMALTGLDEDDAPRAQLREFSETIASDFSPQELAAFHAALAEAGLAAVSGAGFLTVTDAAASKGRAVSTLAELYRGRFGPVVTIALGDGPNDASMFAVVDRAYLVQQPSGQWEDVSVPGLVRVPAVGPQGWVSVIDELGSLSVWGSDNTPSHPR